jgi:inner membrane protein
MKTVLVGMLAVVLLVPVSMIRDLVAERQARRNEAVGEIAIGWGARQTITGPFLVVPYDRTVAKVVQETVDGSTRERRTERTEAGVLRLPADAVEWTIDATTSEKARGIHKARLYTANVEAKGRITLAANFGLADTANRIRWGTPRLVLGVSDPRGIRSVSALSFGGGKYDFVPGPLDATLASGLHAPMRGLNATDTRTLAFAFTLELAGSEALALAPLARDTTVAMRADWPHPSFQGVFLPARHELKADGFAAHWQVSQYAAQGAERLRGCEGARSACPGLAEQTLGVSFVEPVGVYQQLERASKYGFLFIGLMFAAFFLFELMKRLAIHPIQYALVGLALAIFFLLLAALSEHLAFALAYSIATLACVGLVTAYVVHVLDSAAAGSAFGGALAALYGALYLLLKAEDYALLAGSVLLFALLAAAMIATRRIDWYRLTQATGR